SRARSCARPPKGRVEFPLRLSPSEADRPSVRRGAQVRATARQSVGVHIPDQASRRAAPQSDVPFAPDPPRQRGAAGRTAQTIRRSDPPPGHGADRGALARASKKIAARLLVFRHLTVPIIVL